MRLIDADRFDEDGGHYLRARLEFPDGKKTISYFAVLTSVQIKDAPTVDAVPVVHAHWKCNGAWSMAKQCSNCSFVYKGEADYMGNVHYQASNYCPNCGAKMDEEATTT